MFNSRDSFSILRFCSIGKAFDHTSHSCQAFTLLHNSQLFKTDSQRKNSKHSIMECTLEVKALDGNKHLFKSVPLEQTFEHVFSLVKRVEGDTEFKLLAVVNDKLKPVRWAEKERTLDSLGLQQDKAYRIEVCLAWSELKKVLM